MNYKDYYDILGVSKNADAATIKKAYRKLARKYHPDVSKETDAEAKFKDASEAYTVLKDKEKRAEYDQFGKAGRPHGSQPGQAPPGGAAGQSYYYSDQQGSGAGFSDFFESMFGGAGAYQAPNGQAQQQDQHATVQLDLADAYQGTTRELSLSEPVLAPEGHLINKQRKLKVKIPKGISPGQTMRLKSQGMAGLNSSARGDLFLEISFAPHPVYQINGKDLMIELPITPWEAALGAKVHVPLPDGKHVALKLPAGASTGKQLRLKGKGIPAKTPGNMMVVLKIVMPSSISPDENDAYETLQKVSDFDPRKELKI